MKRFSLLLSVATLAAVLGPVGVVRAGCVPISDERGQVACQYLGIPQTQCRAAMYTVITSPEYQSVPPQGRTVVANAGLCEKVPTGVRATGQDGQVFYLGTETVTPESLDVGVNRSIFIHNLDGSQHSFTDPWCLDGISTTPCRFNKLLEVSDWGLFAEFVKLTSPTFKVGGTYAFKCRFNHTGESGTFTVTA